MVFTKRLRERVRQGEITCSVRFWLSPRVTAGTRYRMDEGQIEVDSIEPIGFPDITPGAARKSGFLGVLDLLDLLDLLEVAKHSKGEKIYLVRFHYVPPPAKKSSAKTPAKPRVKPQTAHLLHSTRDRVGVVTPPIPYN